MKKTAFAALAVLGLVLGTLTFAPTEANAAFVPNGHGTTWQDSANG